MRTSLALLLAAALFAMGWIGASPMGAHAAVPDNELAFWPPVAGTNHDGVPVFEEGQEYEGEIGYGIMTPGSTTELLLPEGFTWPGDGGELDVPDGNSAVAGITKNGQTITFTWADPWPEGIDQGSFKFKVSVDSVDESVLRDVVWSLGGEEVSSGKIIVREPGDEFENVTSGFSKAVTNDTFGSPHFTVDGDNNVVVADSAFDVEIPFTITYSTTTAREGLVITDELPDFLVLVAGSGTTRTTTWDENGLNRQVVDGTFPVAAGDSFEYTLDVEADSIVTLSFRAKLDITQRAAIAAAMQDSFDAIYAGEDGGNWGLSLTNTATNSVDANPAQASTWVQGGYVRGPWRPNLNVFSKGVDVREAFRNWEGDDAVLKDYATGDPSPVEVTYTLGADLRQWGDNYDDTRLANDVIVSDALPANATWASGDFITLRTAEGAVTLTPATLPADADPIAFLRTQAPFTYVVDGNNVHVNLGKDHVAYQLSLRAEIDDVANLDDRATDQGARRIVTNPATFHWDGDAVTRTADTSIHRFDDPQEIDWPGKFNKTAPGNEIRTTIGESVDVEFQFVVAAGVGDVSKSTLIDVVDHEVFDVSAANLDEIRAGLKGHIEWWPHLAGDDFDLVLNGDGNLEITLSDAGLAKVTDEPKPLDGRYEVNITLPTHVFEHKSTLEITNSARYVGDDTSLEWVSSSEARATTFGNELELQKRVFDPSRDAFTPNLRVELDEQGEMAEDEFVYRIRLMPHGSFTRMIRDITDVLPPELEFAGFVTSPTGGANMGNHTIPGTSLVVNYDEASNTVRIPRGELQAGRTVDLMFRVKVLEFTPDVAIRNVVGPSTATIVPTDGYPLFVSKADQLDPEYVITDHEARFQVLDEAGENVVVDDVLVDGGQLMVIDDEGNLKALLVEEPGTYTVREVEAPYGYKRTDVTYRVSVDENGGGTTVVIPNEPKTYAVGDFVWSDSDRDGVQDDGEAVLPGVGVEIFQVVGDERISRGTTTTDAQGLYLFDDLRAGQYEVQFTLTAAQQLQYRFTVADATGDAEDSDADPATGRTIAFTLDDANEALTTEYADQTVRASEGIDPTWDAGVVERTYAVGDYVWIDEDGDGLQGDDEPVLADVIVELLDADGAVIDSTETDEHGRYLFDELTAGDYQIRFTLTDAQAEIYNFTARDAGDNALDSDADASGNTIRFRLDTTNASLTTDYDRTVVASEGIDPTWDAGVVVKTYAVGDFVWIDTNRDGVQGDDEPVLPGVKVELLDADGNVVATTDTDGEGRYLFDELERGTYKVRFTLTEEQSVLYKFTTADEGDDSLDSDANPATGESVSFVLDDTNSSLTTDYDRDVLASQGIDPTWDAGVVTKTYAVGDYVWVDTDRDGRQGEDEPVLVGTTVVLLDADGDEVARTATDEQGRYLFDSLTPGQYRVQFILTDEQAALYNFTTANSGGAGEDSDADPATGQTPLFWLNDDNTSLTNDYDRTVVASEGIDPTWDAGVVRKTYAVGDVVWIDEDGNGLQDPGEDPLPGVTVELLDPEGNVVGSTTTDENGRYLIDEIESGEYRVRFTLTPEQQAKYNFTSPNVEGDDSVDSDPDSSGLTPLFPLNDDTVIVEYDRPYGATEGIDPTWDAGVVSKTYAVGDYVWVDSDRDGIQGEDEPVLPGVTVELLDSEGAVVATTTTDDEGRYLFDELLSGTYQVRFTLTEDQALVYNFTGRNVGDDDSVDSDANRIGLTLPFTLDDDSAGLTRDYDRDYLASEGVDPTWDAGVTLKTYAIGDVVWIDSDRDGVQDEGEPVLPGVTVELLVDGEVVDSTTTDADGRYVFDDLFAGEYQVRFSLTDEQALVYNFTSRDVGADDVDSDADPSTGLTVAITLDHTNESVTPFYNRQLLASEGIDPTWDAGVVTKQYAVGDNVWVDSDRDGLQSEGEPVLVGTTVELLDGEGEVVASTTTDEEGRYLFDQLEAGEYQIRFVMTDEQAALYNFTTTDAGDDDAADSDAAFGTGLTEKFVLDTTNTSLTKDYDRTVVASEGVDPTWDAGVVLKTYAIGDYVWIDSDRDGVQDDDEAPLAGVTVELLDEESNVVGTAITDEDGRYLFDELFAGTYQIRFILTEEQSRTYNFTVGHVGEDEGADSDASSIGVTPQFTLNDATPGLTRDYDREYGASEGVDPTWDAGVVTKQYAVGDYVWVDSNRDGLQSEGEPVLVGTTVELLDGEGEVVASTTTDEEGRYLFDRLEAGEYQVRFVLTDEQAALYNFTTTGAGDDDAFDSDAAFGTGLTEKFVLDTTNSSLTKEYDRTVVASEGVDPTWDAGVVRKTYAVGDVVWIDSDRDGVQDEGEPVLPGVVVELLDPEGNVVKSTVTDEEGRYLIDEIESGDYRIRFVLTPEQEAKYNFTSPDAGDDDSTDSDPGRDGLTPVFTLDDQTPGLTRDYDREYGASEGVDPTWDAGVVEKTYAVGDIVWIDANGNGLQDDSEVLEGVKVELLDGEGNVVATTATDANGRYLFDNLRGGDYQIRFTLTDEQAARYTFTRRNAGETGADSDADGNGLTIRFTLDGSNPALTTDYTDQVFGASEGIDPTWDAGVVLKPVKPKPGLPATGVAG